MALVLGIPPAVLPAHAATTNFSADGNGNSAIDAGDYGVWKQNFGRTGGAGAAVPEPGMAILAASAAIALIPLGGRRR